MRYKRAKVKCLDAWRGKVLRFYSQAKCQLFVLGREILVFDQLSGKLAKMLVFWYLINSPRKIRSDSGQIWTFFVIFLYFCWDGQKSKHLRITKNLYKSQHECAVSPQSNKQCCWMGATDGMSRFYQSWMSRRLYVECPKYPEMLISLLRH